VYQRKDWNAALISRGALLFTCRFSDVPDSGILIRIKKQEKRMNEKVISKLEFDKIRERLAERALSDPGRDKALAVMPSGDYAQVKRLQAETLEAESVLMRAAATPMSGFADISAEVARRGSRRALIWAAASCCVCWAC
jgi:hypothetical protein